MQAQPGGEARISTLSYVRLVTTQGLSSYPRRGKLQGARRESKRKLQYFSGTTKRATCSIERTGRQKKKPPEAARRADQTFGQDGAAGNRRKRRRLNFGPQPKLRARNADLWHHPCFRRSFCFVEFIMPHLDLVDLTMREARQLSPENPLPRGTEGSHLLDKLLEVLEGTRTKPSNATRNPQGAVPQNASALSVQLAHDSPLPFGSDEVADRTVAADLPISARAELSASTSVPVIPMLPLLKAILEPGIYAAPADSYRAIALRWVLRDIKANRLTWSPVDPRDLGELIEMGLVEMRNGAPALTNAGVDAII